MDWKNIAAVTLAFAVSAPAFAVRERAGAPVWQNGNGGYNTVYNGVYDGVYPQQDKKALRQAINAKRREVHALRKAGDPRATQAEYELQQLNAQWKAQHGKSKGQGRGHMKQYDRDENDD